MSDVFEQVEKASTGKGTRTTWTGVLSIDLPALNLGSVEYHLRAGKVKGDQEKVQTTSIDKQTGRTVKGMKRPILYRYREGANGEKLDLTEIDYESMKKNARYLSSDGEEWLLSTRIEERFFDAEKLLAGEWEQIPAERVVDKSGEDEVEPFDRTTKLEVGEQDFVSLQRVSEYKFKETYQLNADTDKKVRESAFRIRDLARFLLEKQVALVCFFSWGRGYTYYTAVVHPYERKDGKLWLLMGMSEGILTLDEAWALEAVEGKEAVASVPVASAKKKPKVSLSR